MIWRAEWIIGLVVCIIVAAILGYLVGKHSIRPKGEIVFEPTYDEDNQEGVKCTFKLDLDIDQIVAEDYILFNVIKNKRVMEMYSEDKKK